MKSYEIDSVRRALAEIPELHPLLFGTGTGDEPLGLFNHPDPAGVLRAGLRWASCVSSRSRTRPLRNLVGSHQDHCRTRRQGVARVHRVARVFNCRSY